MKKIILLAIFVLFFIDYAFSQQKGILQEGYHMPGAGYYAPSQNQQSVTGTRSQTNNIQIKETKDGISVHQTQTYVETTDVNKYAKVKKDLQFESQNLKSKYDTCVYRKEQNCQQYYRRMIQIQDQLTAIELIEKQ